LLSRALSALACQNLEEPFEVVVSIDGPDAGSEETAASFGERFPVQVVTGPRGGRAAACNRALAAARGAVVAILDDDMAPVPGWLAAHCRRHPPGSRVCSVGPVPVLIASGDAPIAAYVAARFERHHLRLARPGHRFSLRDFYSGNAAIRRDVLLGAGGFDEAFAEYGNEDVELSLRLRRAGVEPVFEPEAVAYQRYDKDIAGLAADTFAKGRTAVQFARLHPEAASSLHFAERHLESRRWRLAGSSLLALGRRWPAADRLLLRASVASERVPALRRPGVYRFLLDYFYWRGVESAAGTGLRRGAPQPSDGRPSLLLHR
jgi:GT2 family glycosyltransferase